ncbi:hypothetical protein B0H11DRAFT_1372455 [Mycena galericulata]|nr:hypothetical protein B0H11DRAFT_1372455 [Mycena galericulata]
MKSVSVKFKTPTCTMCRRRKLRCDGGDPCGPCSRARTPVTCMYVPKTAGQLRSELPKGAACIPCRQRKRRCDGVFPCRTCKEALRSDECQYRDMGKPSHHKDGLLSEAASTSSASSYRPATPPDFTSHNHRVSILANETIPPFDPFPPWPELLTLCPTHSSDPSDLFSMPTFLDSATFATPVLDPLPRDPGAELYEVRNLFLEHRWQYGLNVTAAKREALSSGDLSGLIVEPTLVHVCELMGYLVRHHSHPDGWISLGTQASIEADLALTIRDKLDGAQGTVPDPLVCLQAYTMLALYYAQKEDISGLQDSVKKANDIVHHHAATLGLEDAPVLDWSPMFDASYLSPRNVAEEVRAAFSMLLWIDIAGSLTLNFPSLIDPRQLETFRRLAAVHRSDTEINFMKTKSLLFVRDSQELVAGWNRWDFADNTTPSDWPKRYWNLIEEIHTHVNFITTALMDVSCIPELQAAQPTLKACTIISLTALTELHGLFASSQQDSRRKHREVVTEIATITRGFSDKDYQYLDPSMSICWSIASRTLYEDIVAWDPHSGAYNANDIRQSNLLFINECNRKLGQVAPCVY